MPRVGIGSGRLHHLNAAPSVPYVAETVRDEGLEALLARHETGPDGRARPRECAAARRLEDGEEVVARLAERLQIAFLATNRVIEPETMAPALRRTWEEMAARHAAERGRVVAEK